MLAGIRSTSPAVAVGPTVKFTPKTPSPSAVTVATVGDTVEVSKFEAQKATPATSDLIWNSTTGQQQLALTQLFGPHCNEETLKALASDCLPSGHPIVKLETFVSPEGQPAMSFSADWRDADGEQIATSSMFWSKNSEGALTLQWRDIWLDPEQRGEGFLERMAERQLEFLRQHSQHPDSKLELSAGGSGKIGQAEKEIVGKYLWARLGIFEFANDQVQNRMSSAFAAWLQEKAQDYPALSSTMVEQLTASSKTWTPEQFAEFDIPYIKVPMQRRDRPVKNVSLGRAFLMSPETPGWLGHCRVGQLQGEKWDRAQRALSFGAGQSAPAKSEKGPQLEAGLVRQASDLSTSAKVRLQHASSLAVLRGQVQFGDFCEQFADLGNPEQLLSHWHSASEKHPNAPPFGKLEAAVQIAMRAAFDQAAAEIGGHLSESKVREIGTRHYGDLAAQKQALAQQNQN